MTVSRSSSKTGTGVKTLLVEQSAQKMRRCVKKKKVWFFNEIIAKGCEEQVTLTFFTKIDKNDKSNSQNVISAMRGLSIKIKQKT